MAFFIERLIEPLLREIPEVIWWTVLLLWFLYAEVAAA